MKTYKTDIILFVWKNILWCIFALIDDERCCEQEAKQLDAYHISEKYTFF